MESKNFTSLFVVQLSVNEMLNVRGGDGDVTNPKGEEIDIIL